MRLPASHSPAARRFFSAWLLLGLGTGCFDDDDEAFAALPCDTLAPSCQDAVYRATAEVAQMRAQGRPPVRSISVAELEDELRELSRDDDPELAASWSDGLSLLGLLPAGQSVQEAALKSAVASISAFYDASSEQVSVVDRSTGDSPEQDLFVLAHELAHALRDAESDLLAFRERHVRSSDSAAASSSLIEGEAMLVGAAVVARTAQGSDYSIDWARFADSVEDSTLDSIEAAPAPLITAIEQLPYAYGTRRLAHAWGLDGRAAVDPFYEDPALTLLSWSGGRGARAEADPLRCFPTTPPAGYAGVDSDTFGIAALIALPIALETDGARAAMDMAQSWRDDRVVVFRRDGAEDGERADHAVAWRLRFASPAEASAMADGIGCCLPATMRRIASGDDRELLYVAGASATLDSWTGASACGAEADVPVAPSPMTRMGTALR
jgi:hypothetical protein